MKHYRFLGCIALLLPLVLITVSSGPAKGAKIAQEDYMIDGADPGIKLSVREKYPEGMKISDPTMSWFSSTAPPIPASPISICRSRDIRG